MTAVDITGDWATALAEEARTATCLTVGITDGSRADIDRRVLDRLIGELAERYEERQADEQMLVLRLSVFASRQLDRAADQPATIPVAQRSPLGAWSEVTVPVPVGARASWSLQQLPDWLPTWKASFGLILIDLGPVNLVPSRIVGRLCDSCYLVLGPDSCASKDWIMEQIAWHGQSGSTICGTLLSSFAAA